MACATTVGNSTEKPSDTVRDASSTTTARDESPFAFASANANSSVRSVSSRVWRSPVLVAAVPWLVARGDVSPASSALRSDSATWCMFTPRTRSALRMAYVKRRLAVPSSAA